MSVGTGVVGGLFDLIGASYGQYTESQRAKFEAQAVRDVGIAQANATASAGLANSQQLNLVLLGAAALVGVLIWKLA